MWTLLNRTPYAVDRTWVRDKEGTHVWVVAPFIIELISLVPWTRRSRKQYTLGPAR